MKIEISFESAASKCKRDEGEVSFTNSKNESLEIKLSNYRSLMLPMANGVQN
jgi:hypothetical protein